MQRYYLGNYIVPDKKTRRFISLNSVYMDTYVHVTQIEKKTIHLHK